MEKRQIRMQDGRYLIFYTFTDEGDASPHADAVRESDKTKEEPSVKPEAEEERGV
jgi:hypothetical protein